MALPLLYTILQSLKPLDELFIFPPRFFVRRPTLENFIQLKNITSDLWVPFSRYLFNSVFLTVFCTAIQVVFASMAAYPLAKHKFPGQKVFFNMVVLSLLFTNEVTFIPLYIMLSSMHLINSYMALILPVAAFPLGLYLMRQNLLGFPDSVIESARIDGANRWQTAFKVTLPSIAPTVTVLLLLAISGILGSGFDRIYMLQNPLNLVRSEVLDTFVYKMGISSRRFSYTTAIGLFRSVLAVLLLGGGNLLSKKLTGNGLF